MNLPTDPRELDLWLEDYTKLKKDLVRFATTNYEQEIQAKLGWDDDKNDWMNN